MAIDLFAEHTETLRDMQPFVGENLGFLGEVGKAWQPTDYLPDLSAENWHEQIADFRQPLPRDFR